MVLSVLIRYPRQSKERNKIFFKKKDQELTNLDWAKWGGWDDTDGWFTVTALLQGKTGLYLKDRQPVELFARTFETSLCCRTFKTITPEPYRKEYTITVYRVDMCGQKARWFTKKVYPYLIKQAKKDYAAKLLGYHPESKDFTDWTPAEVRNYIATALEGDGSITVRSGKKTKYLSSQLKSSDVQYLSDVKYLIENKLGLVSKMREIETYQTQEGIKTKYELRIDCSRQNPENLGFFQSLVKEGVMTLDRKRQKVQEFVNQ